MSSITTPAATNNIPNHIIVITIHATTSSISVTAAKISTVADNAAAKAANPDKIVSSAGLINFASNLLGSLSAIKAPAGIPAEIAKRTAIANLNTRAGEIPTRKATWVPTKPKTIERATIVFSLFKSYTSKK